MNYKITKGTALKAVNDLNQELDTLMKELKRLHVSIRSFIAEGELNGRGYDEAKEYFSGYITLLEAMNGICLTIGEKNKTLSARMRQDFIIDESPLESAKLEAKIKELRSRIESYECEMTGSGQYSFKLTSSRALAAKLQTQLELMQSFETETAAMFDEAEAQLNTLRKYIEEMNKVGTFEAAEGIFRPVDLKGLKGLESDVEDMLKGLQQDKTYGLDRSDMDTDPAQMQGLDPVNLANGNYMYRKGLLRTGGILPLEIEIGYNSLDKEKSRLGSTGWTHNLDYRITDHGNHVVVEGSFRSRDVFLDKGGEYEHIRHSGYRKLERSEAGYKYTNEKGERLYFDKDGRISVLRRKDGQELIFEHEGERLVKVYTKHGLCYTFIYGKNAGEDDRLSEIRDHSGRSVSFIYSGVPNECEAEGMSVMLTEIRDEEGESYRYGYNSFGELESIINARGTLNLVNSYDMRGRVLKQSFPDGTEIEVEYDDERRLVRAKEKDGSRSEYEHDELYRNTAASTSSGREERIYDSHGNCILRRDRRGNERRYEYDEAGRLIRETGPLGDVFEAEYDEEDRLIRLTVNGLETERHSYENGIEEHTDGIGRKTRVELNEDGQAVKVTKPDGSTVRYSYDAAGNLTEVTDALGASEKYEYDLLCRLAGREDAGGRRESYRYNRRGELTEVKNAAGDIRRYRYNESGKPVGMTDYDGSEESAEYNELNRISVYIDKDGNKTEYGYDSMWNLSEIRDPEGGRRVLSYDAEGRLLRETVSGGISVHYSYDREGNMVQKTDEEGNSTDYIYDAENRLTAVHYADGTEEHYTYDAMDNVIKYTDETGNEWETEYNAAGEAVRQTGPDGAVTSYRYDLNGNLTEEVTCDARTVYEYDLAGRLVRRSEADGAETVWSYAASGEIAETIVNGVTASYSYDCLGRVTEERTDGKVTARYGYDAVSNICWTEDGEGNRTSYLRSASGDILAVTDPLGNVTRLRYDRCHRLMCVVRGEGKSAAALDMRQLETAEEIRRLNETNAGIRITSYERDIRRQITAVTDALGNTERYEYDRRGSVKAKTDMDGNRISVTRTVHGDVSAICYGDGMRVEYSYDRQRRLREIRDTLGRETAVTDHKGRTVRYGYDMLGRRTSMTYPDGRSIRYEYDGKNRLTEMRTEEFRTELSYDGYGRLTGRRTGEALTEYSYDSAGRLACLTNSYKGIRLDSYKYSYNCNGDLVTSKQERAGMPCDSGVFRYGYDALNRLTGVSRDGRHVRTYTYDAFGNRLSRMEAGTAAVYRYNKADRLIAQTDEAGETEYRYDRRGNLTERLLNGSLQNSYEYDAANRLAAATDKDGNTARYMYNGLGLRMSRAAGGQSIDYILDQTKMYNNLLEEVGEETKRDYIWDNDTLIAGGGEIVLTDRLATPIRICGTNGGAMSYDEFGVPVNADGSADRIGSTCRLGYIGYRADDISGTYFAQAREYLPEAGRFAGRDILKGKIDRPASLNEYVYCHSNPLGFVDFNGMSEKTVDEYIENGKRGAGENIGSSRISVG